MTRPSSIVRSARMPFRNERRPQAHADNTRSNRMAYAGYVAIAFRLSIG